MDRQQQLQLHYILLQLHMEINYATVHYTNYTTLHELHLITHYTNYTTTTTTTTTTTATITTTPHYTTLH